MVINVNGCRPKIPVGMKSFSPSSEAIQNKNESMLTIENLKDNWLTQVYLEIAVKTVCVKVKEEKLCIAV